jgi:HD-like signal output (HDOD) protein
MSQVDMIARLNELPRIQSLLQELLEMVNQEDVSFSALSKKISIDQVLTARLLRMANSAYFSGSKTISTVNDAIIRVGIGPVKTLVVASVLSSAFSGVTTLDLDKYWAETFEVSLIASHLAKQLGLDANQIFTIGVLHDVGELMIHTLVPNQALQIQGKIGEGADRLSAEYEILETTGPQLGARLAKEWKFPDIVADVIEHSHNPIEAKVSPQFASIINLSRAINLSWDEFSDDVQKENFIQQQQKQTLFNIPKLTASIVDKHRGEGRELAAQMV